MSPIDNARAVITLARDEELTFLAAAIAYYAFVSLLPALLLALAIGSSIGGPRLADAIVAGTGDALTPAVEALIRNAVRDDAGRAGATVVGAVGLSWSALKVFRGIEIAIARLYGAPPRGVVARFRDAVVVVVAIGVGVAGMLLIGGLVVADPSPQGRVIALTLLLAGLVAVFLPLYVVFPEGVTVREALPGTLLAAVGWVALQALFQVYAEVAGRFEFYGVIGGILLLVTWFYVAAILLLVGAAVNVVLADRGNRQVQGRGA